MSGQHATIADLSLTLDSDRLWRTLLGVRAPARLRLDDPDQTARPVRLLCHLATKAD